MVDWGSRVSRTRVGVGFMLLIAVNVDHVGRDRQKLTFSIGRLRISDPLDRPVKYLQHDMHP
jgi:hypothetical protein